MNTIDLINNDNDAFTGFLCADKQIKALEDYVLRSISSLLKSEKPARTNRKKCDEIFGIYTHRYLINCCHAGLASRAAYFSESLLVPEVLKLENELNTEFHKGALYYDTALAHYSSGNEDRFQYFLALTDEEELKTNGTNHKRGTINLRNDEFTKKTLSLENQFACDLLNGAIAGNSENYAFFTGLPRLTLEEFYEWRKTLEPLDQFELLRIIHDLEVFLGSSYPQYQVCETNPFILYRLAKALAHLAQLVESCLTHWQAVQVTTPYKTLSEKLKCDGDFGGVQGPLALSAGNQEAFAGNYSNCPDVDSELEALLTDIRSATFGDQRNWRLLRILYFARNATAHYINDSSRIYNDREFLLNLIQHVFISLFVICQLKRQPMPINQKTSCTAYPQTIGYSGVKEPQNS